MEEGPMLRSVMGLASRLDNVNNIIIHGLNIHDCNPSVASNVQVTESASVTWMTKQDPDAISITGCKDIWIDHNNLSRCLDGLIDVSLASTAITISNNRFTYHDKVMLLGHSDDYAGDKNMKVTVTYNHFGPGVMQRMPSLKQVIRREPCNAASSCPGGWLWESVRDMLANGASFVPFGKGNTFPTYAGKQGFTVSSASLVPEITRDAGALACIPSGPCV